MNDRIQGLIDYIVDANHMYFRHISTEASDTLAHDWKAKNLKPIDRAIRRFEFFMQNEQPCFLPDYRIAFFHTLPTLPELLTDDEWEDIRETRPTYRRGRVGNIVVNYADLLSSGFLNKKKAIEERLLRTTLDTQRDFLRACLACVDGILTLSEKYSKAAEENGNGELSETIHNAVNNGASSFHEALQLVRIVQFALWCAGHNYNPLGRIDQYLLPYYEADKRRGMQNDEFLSLLEEFFICLHIDSDLYTKIQDEPFYQSVTIGGLDNQGRDALNDLTMLTLVASLELDRFAPVINLRVNSKTPAKIFELSGRLAKQARMQPVISNDDIIIPALIQRQIDIKDALDYALSDFGTPLIPGKSFFVPDIAHICLPEIILKDALTELVKCRSLRMFITFFARDIREKIEALPNKLATMYMEPAPMLSLLMDGCIETATDITENANYMGYGIAPTGLATAANCLAALRYAVYDQKTIAAQTLTYALTQNFVNAGKARLMLKHAPVVGTNDQYADEMLNVIIFAFSEAFRGIQGERGLLYLPGSSPTAYEALLDAKKLDATPDGRYPGDPISAGFSPMVNDRVNDVVNIIRSFSKPDMTRMPFGGILKLKLMDEDSLTSSYLSKLMQVFIANGGCQLSFRIKSAKNEEVMDTNTNETAADDPSINDIEIEQKTI